MAKAVRDHIEVRQLASEEHLPVFLFGHSLGGLVTAGSVALKPEGLAGVIISGAALPDVPPAIAISALGIIAAMVPQTSVFLKPTPISGISRIPEIVEKAEKDPMLVKRQLPYLLGVTALRTARSISDRTSTWTVPTMIMHGTADIYTDAAGSKKLFKAIMSTDKTLELYDGAYHELLNDLGRDEVLLKMLTWLDARVPQRGE